MMIADLQVEDKVGKPKFFQQTFLVADTKFEFILGIFFLKLSNADISFSEETLMWRTYTTNKALPTIKQVKIIDKKDFVIVALNANSEMFIEHVAIREQEEILVHFKKQAQIKA